MMPCVLRCLSFMRNASLKTWDNDCLKRFQGATRQELLYSINIIINWASREILTIGFGYYALEKMESLLLVLQLRRDITHDVVGHVVSHMVDLSYQKSMRRQVRPFKYEEAPRKYLLDPNVMKESSCHVGSVWWPRFCINKSHIVHYDHSLGVEDLSFG